MELNENDYLTIRFRGLTPHYADFLRSCYLNVLISCSKVDIEDPYSNKTSVMVQITACGIDRIEKLINDFSGEILFRSTQVRE